jgi:hypothetical protein
MDLGQVGERYRGSNIIHIETRREELKYRVESPDHLNLTLA